MRLYWRVAEGQGTWRAPPNAVSTKERSNRLQPVVLDRKRGATMHGSR